MPTVALSEILTGFHGFSAFARLGSMASAVQTGEIIIDCSEAHWFDANMVAVLGGLREFAESKGIELKLANMRPRVATVLSKNGFLSARIPDTYGTTIRYERFETTEAKEFAAYAEDQLMSQDIPIMSDEVRRRFLEGLDEIFDNAAIHSKTEYGVHSCGQVFPRRQRLLFTIADLGIGIPANVQRVVDKRLNAIEAIDMAMMEGFTSRSLDVPGGLGLKLLKEFVSLNDGRLIVVSENGYWEMRRGAVTTRHFLHKLPGTIVSLEINMADENKYSMRGEINPETVL